MNRLILIRHGQSEHHVQGLTGGWTDTTLTPLGRQQARAAVRRCREILEDDVSVSIHTSDLLRAAQTAHFVAEALGVECRSEPALREINNGKAMGLTWEEANKIELPKTEPNEHWRPYEGAESWHMMTERVYSGMEQINETASSTAVAVTHGISAIAVIQWWLQLDRRCRQGVSFELDPASISVLGINSHGERTIARLNDIAHLQPDGLARVDM